MTFRFLLVLILAGVVALFLIQNVAVMEIQFMFWSIQMSRAMLMFLLLAIGIVIGWFLHGYMQYRKAKSQ